MINPSNFHKTHDDREKAVSEVGRYLKDEENWLLDSILQAFHITPDGSPFKGEGTEDETSEKPLLLASISEEARFSAVIDAVIGRIDCILDQKLTKLSPKEFDVIIAHINAAFRHYEEIMESCASQLFHELEKVRVDEFVDEALRSIESVKDRMISQIEECILQIRRLERKLSECAGGVQSRWSFVASVSRFFRSVLDKSIVAKLKKIKQMVSQGYAQLHTRYSEYQRLNQAALARMKKLERFEVFHKLPADSQQELTEIYRLIKVRELNKRGSELLSLELDRVLRETVSVSQASSNFEQYFKSLEDAIFALRRELTQCPAEELSQAVVKEGFKEKIQAARREVHVLGSLILKFRDFVLSTHPDPYVRARLGFSERTVGPEPEETRCLMQLGLRVEALDTRFAKLATAVDEYKTMDPQGEELGYFDEIIGDLERLSWEAKTRDEAQLFYQSFLMELQEVQEVYSFDRFRVMGLEKVLRLALRLDHFHVLAGEAKFCDLYETHIMVRGYVPNIEQRKHLKKLAKVTAELSSLRTSTAHLSQSARTIAANKAESWAELASKVLDNLEAFIQEERAEVPLTLNELFDKVVGRRYEVLEFLFAYHSLMNRLEELEVGAPPVLKTLMDRVHKIEGDFAYLSSHHERVSGPMSMSALRALESF